MTQEKKYKQGDKEKSLEKIKPKEETQECGVEKKSQKESERERWVWRLTCSGLNLVEIREIQHQQQGLLSSCGREGHASGFFFFYEESSEFVIERRDSRSKNTIALCKPSS
jgi:hypothetical protein